MAIGSLYYEKNERTAAAFVLSRVFFLEKRYQFCFPPVLYCSADDVTYGKSMKFVLATWLAVVAARLLFGSAGNANETIPLLTIRKLLH
jgi:hypothetical protein